MIPAATREGLLLCVYVLVGDGGGFYDEMLLLSVHSLKHHNPAAIVRVVMDRPTHERLKRKNATVLRYVEVIVTDVPVEYDNVHRSRYLKTRLRNIIAGDFLFIDTDTVICAPLGEIVTVDADMAQVIDNHVNYSLKGEPYVSRCRQAGVEYLLGEPYFNSGVMFVRDTPMTHQFYDLWHRYWLATDARGVYFDQVAMLQTDTEMGHVIREIPGIWNCMIITPTGLLRYVPDAKIIHYFNATKFCVRRSLFSAIKRRDSIDGMASLVCRWPRTFGIFILLMGDMDVLRQGVMHPRQGHGLEDIMRWILYTFMFAISKVIYWLQN